MRQTQSGKGTTVTRSRSECVVTSIRGQVNMQGLHVLPLPHPTVTRATTNALCPGAAVSPYCEALMKLTAPESWPPVTLRLPGPEGSTTREGYPHQSGANLASSDLWAASN